jgi:hypothetical protein
MSCHEGVDFSGMKTIPGVVWKFFFLPTLLRKKNGLMIIRLPISTLEPFDRYLQNLVWTLYAVRGILRAMVFNFVQLVRATWQGHELLGRGRPGGGGGEGRAELSKFCLGSWGCVWWWSLREILNYCEDNVFRERETVEWWPCEMCIELSVW